MNSVRFWRDTLVRYNRGEWMYPPCPDVFCHGRGNYDPAYPSVWGPWAHRCPHSVRLLPAWTGEPPSRRCTDGFDYCTCAESPFAYRDCAVHAWIEIPMFPGFKWTRWGR